MSSAAASPSIAGQPSHAAHKLLAKSLTTEAAQKVFTDKVLHKPLLLNPSTDHLDNSLRAKRRYRRLHKKAYAVKHARPKPLSAKEKRVLKIYQLRPQDCSYETYKGLHSLWTRYILEVLGYMDRNGAPIAKAGGLNAQLNGSAIAGADFHGMEVEIVQCRDHNRIGLRGIVVKETRSTISIVCDQKETSPRKLKAEFTDEKNGAIDKVRMVLKGGTIFRVRVAVPNSQEVLSWDLQGSMLETRPTERASKKWKYNWKKLMDSA